ncbi:MAG TPA: hypothetical protein VKB66_04085 [Candidatus Acidoferrum sp.]|nr:hypothetical protein [Candidatus Acidoferrum sp.]
MKKRIALALLLAVAFFGLGSCKKQTSDNDAIRAGIVQHLTSIGTLNMSAMDMDLRSVSVTGNQAHAEVEFRIKTNGPPGGGMQVAYDLEKRGSDWVVLKSQPLGGAMQHPHTSENANTNLPVHSMPNFKELLDPSGAPGQTRLPPGHQPVGSPKSTAPPAAQAQPSTTKPQ